MLSLCTRAEPFAPSGSMPDNATYGRRASDAQRSDRRPHRAGRLRRPGRSPGHCLAGMCTAMALQGVQGELPGVQLGGQCLGQVGEVIEYAGKPSVWFTEGPKAGRLSDDKREVMLSMDTLNQIRIVALSPVDSIVHIRQLRESRYEQ